MPDRQDAFWFKSRFQPRIEAAIAGTPFSVDMITAFALARRARASKAAAERA